MQLLDNDQFSVLKSGDGFVWGEVTTTPKLLPYLRIGELTASFDGLSSLLRFLPEHMAEPKEGKASKTGDNDFSGGFTYDQALSTFTHNPSKVRSFTELDTALNGGDVSGLVNIYDVAGDTLDVGKYLDGEPEAFASLTDGTPRGKRANIVINLSAVWSTEASIMLARQKRIVRLVDWLETQSIRTQITAIVSHECQHLEIQLKRYHEALDLNDIAVTAHPAFLRRLGFRLIEYSKTYSGNYGSSSKFNDAVRSRPTMFDSGDLAETVIYIGSNYDSVESSFNSLEAKLTEQLAAGTNATLSACS